VERFKSHINTALVQRRAGTQALLIHQTIPETPNDISKNSRVFVRQQPKVGGKSIPVN
jgi:hypothetical protein